MRIKCLAQGHNILLPGFEPSASVSKTDILSNRPICSYISIILLLSVICVSHALRFASNCQPLLLGAQLFQGYFDDARNSDNAWIETSVLSFHDDSGEIFHNFDLRVSLDIGVNCPIPVSP